MSHSERKNKTVGRGGETIKLENSRDELIIKWQRC